MLIIMDKMLLAQCLFHGWSINNHSLFQFNYLEDRIRKPASLFSASGFCREPADATLASEVIALPSFVLLTIYLIITPFLDRISHYLPSAGENVCSWYSSL